jgi:hypothetical protein
MLELLLLILNEIQEVQNKIKWTPLEEETKNDLINHLGYIKPWLFDLARELDERAEREKETTQETSNQEETSAAQGETQPPNSISGDTATSDTSNLDYAEWKA